MVGESFLGCSPALLGEIWKGFAKALFQITYLSRTDQRGSKFTGASAKHQEHRTDLTIFHFTTDFPMNAVDYQFLDIN